MSSGTMIYLYFARTFFIRGFGATPLIKLWYVLAEILKDFFLCFSISFGFEWFSTHKRTLWWETIKWLFFRFKKCFLDIGLLQHPRWRGEIIPKYFILDVAAALDTPLLIWQVVFKSEYFFFKVQSSHQRCSIKKGILRNVKKLTGKHLWQSLFFNKVEGLQFYWKRDSGTVVFPWILWNF